MRRDEVLRLLNDRQTELKAFGVKSLSLFGSMARDEAGLQSDVDFLVEFEGIPTFDRYMGLKIYLEDLLGVQVDLVTPRSLKPRVRPYVEREAIRVA
ncbi:MAG TPA: nucleotidyltransferase family protein [Anaerolineae bacterium]